MDPPSWLRRMFGAETDALTVHRNRLMAPMATVGSIVLLPLAINHLWQGRITLALAVGAVAVVLAIDAVAIHRRRQPPLAFWLLLLPMIGAAGFATARQGVYGALWAFPIVLFCYFLLPRRVALACSLGVLGVFTALVYRYVGVETAPRFFAALLMSIVMVNVVLRILNELQDALVEQANTDALTGAFNRRYLDVCVAEAIERRRRHGTPASLLLIDVDHFKRINDRLGHQSGDEVLRTLVRAFSARKRSLDRLFRCGGEEFVLLLPDTRIADAMMVAERLRALAETTPVIDQPVTVSIGVAALGDGQTQDEWMRHADGALYEAKNAGRNRVVAA
ncbi:MAG: GGDEF domain-containing protein [Burkholderiaceae bacterium]|nr:GGDEF domain-containing protein [Burkholderiaceae bacterium]